MMFGWIFLFVLESSRSSHRQKYFLLFPARDAFWMLWLLRNFLALQRTINDNFVLIYSFQSIILLLKISFD